MILSVISLTVLLGLGWYGYTYRSIPALLVLLGGTSNLLEKVLTGEVKDLLVIGTLAFNPADVLIAIGVLGFCRSVLK